MIGRTIEPEKNNKIPDGSQWLPGEGCGVWFHIEQVNENIFNITRYNTDYEIEFQHSFSIANTKEIFNPLVPYTIKHISHGTKVQAEQNNTHYIFKKITE